jgi:hypothetical protein
VASVLCACEWTCAHRGSLTRWGLAEQKTEPIDWEKFKKETGMPELVSAYEKAFKGTCHFLPCLGTPPGQLSRAHTMRSGVWWGCLRTRWALRRVLLWREAYVCVLLLWDVLSTH